MRGLPYILLFILALSACKDSTRFVQRLDDIDSLIDVAPDSAYSQLVRMHDEADNQRTGIRMRYELTLAKAQNKNYIDFTTDSVMKQVVEYYDDNGTPNQQMYANYLLGCTYRDLGDAPTELEYFQKAVESADTTAEDCDFYTLAAVYGQMANIYDDQYLPEEELNALRRAEVYSLKCNDSLNALHAYALRIRPYCIIDEQDSVLTITKRARQMFLERDEKRLAAQYLCPSINILIKQKKWDEAAELLNIFQKESGNFDNLGNLQNSRVALYYYYKGMLLLHNGDIPAAINTFRLLLPHNENEAMCKGLFEAYSALHNTDSISKYAELYTAYNDSANTKEGQNTIEQLTAMYNYNRHRSIAEQQKVIADRANHSLQMVLMIATIAILCIVIIIVIIILLYHKKTEKQKKNNIFLTRSYNNAIDKLKDLEQQLIQATHSNIRNEEEIETNNKEREVLQNEIQNLKKEIQKFKAFDSDIEFNAWFETFRNTPIINELHSKIIKIRPYSNIAVDEKDWNRLIAHYQKALPYFYHTICAPDYKLNDTDIIVIMLIILDFSGKEISILTSKMPQQVSNIRHRIYTKLFPDGKNTRNLRKELLLMLHETQFKA